MRCFLHIYARQIKRADDLEIKGTDECSQYMKENVNLKCGQKLSRFIFAVYQEAKFKKRKNLILNK